MTTKSMQLQNLLLLTTPLLAFPFPINGEIKSGYDKAFSTTAYISFANHSNLGPDAYPKAKPSDPEAIFNEFLDSENYINLKTDMETISDSITLKVMKYKESKGHYPICILYMDIVPMVDELTTLDLKPVMRFDGPIFYEYSIKALNDGLRDYFIRNPFKNFDLLLFVQHKFVELSDIY